MRQALKMKRTVQTVKKNVITHLFLQYCGKPQDHFEFD